MKLLIATLFLALQGCNSDKITESCDELSMQKFRGVPMANKRFKEKCQGAKIIYTPQLCQSALGELMGSNNLSKVKLKFGDPIEKCFTEMDLKRFNRP